MPELEFDEKTHEYRLCGKVVRSVTQVLQDVGIVSFGGVPPDVLERARAKGQAVHVACHYFDENDLDWSSLAPELVPYVQAYQKFKTDTGFHPDMTEQKVWSYSLGIVGTLDRCGKVPDGRRWLIDLKAGEVPDWGGLQLAGYDLCLPLGEARHRFGLQLKSDGTYNLVPFKDRQDFNVFIGAVNVARWMRDHGRIG